MEMNDKQKPASGCICEIKIYQTLLWFQRGYIDKKKMHNQLIKVENCDLLGRLSEDSSLGGSLLDSSEGLLWKGREPEYIGVLATKIK